MHIDLKESNILYSDVNPKFARYWNFHDFGFMKLNEELKK